jgi:protein-L-isoaspartate(D-aspartate) O-methyltransferase
MSFDFAAARTNMVDSQVRTNDVPDLPLQTAMGAAPREKLAPAARDFAAYADAQVEWSEGRHLLTPRDVAKLLHAVAPKAGEKALCVDAPYAAMVLARLGLSVTVLTAEGAAFDAASKALADEGVTVLAGDLAQPKGAGFDVIVAEGAVVRAPEAWTAALAEGGRLGVIERDGPIGKANVYLKGAGPRFVFDATPHYIPGFERKAAFAF